jgi:hypothetical protein
VVTVIETAGGMVPNMAIGVPAETGTVINANIMPTRQTIKIPLVFMRQSLAI